MRKKYFIFSVQRIIFILIFLLFNSSLLGQELIGKINIPNGEKNITNLSGKINDSICFSIVINKRNSTHDYKSTMYILGLKRIIKTLSQIITKDKPNFLSFHKNENLLTLIRKTADSIIIEDYDYTNDYRQNGSIMMKPKNIFSYDDATYFISDYEINMNFVKVLRIKSSKDVTKFLVKAKEANEKSFLYNLNGAEFEIINDEQFIQKGSIRKYKGFKVDNRLIIVNDNKKKSIVELFIIDEKGKLDSKIINLYKNKTKSKMQQSVIKDSLLFVFSMLPENARLGIFDIKTLHKKTEFEYNIENFGQYNKVVINGNEKASIDKPRKFYKSFFPSVGSTYNASLYIGVNKTKKNNNYLVQIGHVDKATYQNHAKNNFWWNYPAFGVNFNLSTNTFSSGFNPAGISMLVFNALAEEKRKGNYFDLYLDEDFHVSNDSVEYEYRYIDIQKYNKRLKNLMKLDRTFYISLSDVVRLVNFNKKSNSYEFFNLTYL